LDASFLGRGGAFFVAGLGLEEASASVVDVRAILEGRRGLNAGVFRLDDGYVTCSLGSLRGGGISLCRVEGVVEGRRMMMSRRWVGRRVVPRLDAVVAFAEIHNMDDYVSLHLIFKPRYLTTIYTCHGLLEYYFRYPLVTFYHSMPGRFSHIYKDL
jgi:hypothetical protein